MTALAVTTTLGWADFAIVFLLALAAVLIGRRL